MEQKKVQRLNEIENAFETETEQTFSANENEKRRYLHSITRVMPAKVERMIHFAELIC